MRDYLYLNTAMYVTGVSDYVKAQHVHNIKTISNCEPGQKLFLEIDSNGGNLELLIDYISAIETCQGKVHGIIKKAISAAYILSRHLDSLVIDDNAVIMIHLPRYYDRVIYTDGSVEDVITKKTGQDWLDAVDAMEPYLDILNIKERLRLIEYEDIYLTGKQMTDRLESNRRKAKVQLMLGAMR